MEIGGADLAQYFVRGTSGGLEHPSNGPLESGHVAEREPGRGVAVAPGDRLEQLGVVTDMLGQVGQHVDHQAPDPDGQVVVANENVLQVQVAGSSVDEPVNGHVLAEEGGAV